MKLLKLLPVLLFSIYFLISCEENSKPLTETATETSTATKNLKVQAESAISLFENSIDLRGNTLFILNANNPQRKHLKIYAPKHNTVCDKDSIGEINEENIMLLNKVQANTLKIEAVSTIPSNYSTKIEISDLTDINAGFQILYQQNNDGEDIPVIYGETDDRDSDIMNGVGLNLNQNKVYITLENDYIYLYCKDSLEKTKDCASQLQTKIIEFSNCEYCKAESDSTACYFSKCIGLN